MKKFLISILVLSTTFIGCSTDLDINRDPDLLDPNSAPLSAQLPSGIVGLIGSEGASLAIIGGMWSQYWTQSNAANQYKDIDNYSIGTADYNFAWDGMFDALGDIRNVKKRALTEGNWKYYLIATTLEVQASQILTDFYGNIPYKEANNNSILEPKFNTGQEVYDFMIQDLNDALSKDLSASTGSNPASDDFIFAGDMTKWTKLANTLKLKIYMRQTEKNKAVADAGITKMLADGVTFLDVDAGMTQFTDAINQSNPLFEYNNRRLNVATNLRMSTTLASFFDDNADTRKAAYYLPGNSLNQGDFTNPVGAGTIAIVKLSATTPAYLMTKEESFLLQAEALERYKSGTGAKALYDAAISANFSRYSLNGAAFVSGAYAYPTAGTFDQKLEAIITQKWVASFPGNGFEAFFEKNRTGYPKTSAVAQSNTSYVSGQFAYAVNGTTAGLFPKRIAYPLSERNANPNAPTLIPITTPVWWNK
ncbi:SusD/RagB family nutrient-binding outer membrane lipoprotein [Flavobacterium gawalongense]|uniref:SusD/RagB family nutrient-binding outer membrane lipoprotein n=1 Tax=Flavobacterium gawalongense TaxID=2594432 RepID=A0A553BYP4_9FLAO|nr:SusD/RagB family nutrient-binding outer membrane lipoprotein [Flavobacterium gawalongense]TRX13335.1 SusD/RagB family nutrient-binding outer membrane lipoprotein [Flavobacterium gawalongense]TRX15735.1 SusD/RagB family nutrient-binding outer membrane lipoprotein [Flavobacterium gawalongense]TRX31573.1 SusD/RagB family nutrient-binding outer membrane lipoprotein [Flavobacterium gawalongense]